MDDPIKGRNARRWIAFTAPIKAAWEAQAAPCSLCGAAIDYRADRRRDPLSLHVDHVVSRKQRPDLAYDRANVRPAHRRCNLSKQDRPTRAHTVRTREW